MLGEKLHYSLLLAKGNRSALPSCLSRQATDVELAREEATNVKEELVKLFSRHTGKTTEQIEADIRRPDYFNPSEAVEYRIIAKVVYNDRSPDDQGVVSDLKKAQLL